MNSRSKTALDLAYDTLEREVRKRYYWMKVSDDELIKPSPIRQKCLSTHSWDLYWIAVHVESRNKNLIPPP
jgi:hypothetical protein